MSDFKTIHVTFSILKLQKCDAYQNGVEFRHKTNGNDVKWPPPLFFPPPPLLYLNPTTVMVVLLLGLWLCWTVTIRWFAEYECGKSIPK